MSQSYTQRNFILKMLKTSTFLVDVPPLVGAKRNVYMKVVFLKVGEIDTVKEKYQADVYVQARWREPLLDMRQNLNVDFTKYWNPKLIIQNLTDHKKKKTWREIQYGKLDEAYVVEKRRIHGHFSEKLELDSFPFDSQYLNLSISSELGANELDIVEDDQEISFINVSCFIDEQEWSLYDFVSSIKHVTTKEFSRSKNMKYPGISFGCCAVRRYGFFIWNMILIMTFISLLSFSTFAVSRTFTQNRLQLSITLMLTSVAFRFVTNQNLPKISYLTYMDIFILYCITFTFGVCMWHAIISRFESNPALQEVIDNWAFVVFVIIYFLFNFVFFTFIMCKVLLRRSLLKDREKRYEEKAIKIIGGSWRNNRNEKKVTAKTRIKKFGKAKIADEDPITVAQDVSYMMYSDDD